MSPRLLTHVKTHYGICSCHSTTDPDSLVIIESSFWTCDMAHMDVWIGRFAEAPWDALEAFQNETNQGFTWFVVTEQLRH